MLNLRSYDNKSARIQDSQDNFRPVLVRADVGLRPDCIFG